MHDLRLRSMQKWGNFVFNGDRFTRMVYAGCKDVWPLAETAFPRGLDGAGRHNRCRCHWHRRIEYNPSRAKQRLDVPPRYLSCHFLRCWLNDFDAPAARRPATV
ncbi:hypothetical protein ACTMU2_14535 [Cupriavidus basilensis]